MSPREGTQLDGWACPAWPLGVLATTERAVLEAPVEGLLLGQYVIDDACELQGDQGARELLRDAVTIELPGGELDIDTAPDLAEAIRRFQ